ncbi:MAG: histidine--tRNA ligase [Bdellovibrionales bacterium]|nr:histidine--tRNA ligase [Bdellovibrionales bacterium]
MSDILNSPAPQQKLQRVRGTRDLMPQDNLIYRHIEETAWSMAQRFGYQEIDTPIFEFTEVFHRTLGETSDVIHKETYTFVDRGGDSLTLRPEGTAGIARAFISEGLAQSIPLKFYYSGSMFRYERPQKGRFREFHQLGVECLGLETPLADVDSILLGWQMLQNLGLAEKCTLEINTLGDSESRLKFREALVAYFSKYENDLSNDSKMRLEKNPLRILDSKDPGDRKLVVEAPQLQAFLNDNSRAFFAQVQDGLDRMKIPIKLNAQLVRGLDYYCHTVFEFVTSELGAQGTVLAGGRYDGLIEMMGGPRTPGIGWAAGVERLSDLLDLSRLPKPLTKLIVIPADPSGESRALTLCTELRKMNYCVEVLWTGQVGKRMKKANSLGATHVFLLGETEVLADSVTCKNMISGAQKLLKLADLYRMTTFDLV